MKGAHLITLLLSAFVLIVQAHISHQTMKFTIKKIELDLRKFSNGPFSETEKGFGEDPTPREVARVQGFQPLFHEIDLAQHFHPLSG